MTGVASAKRAGFTLHELTEIFRMYRAGSAPCRTVRDLLQQKLADLDREVNELLNLRTHLRRVFVRWKGRLRRASSGDFKVELIRLADQPDISRMTITLRGDDVAVEQAAKQLYRLIDVLKVQDVTAEPTVQQELALVKIRATDSNRAEVLKLVELSRGRVVDLADGSVIVEVTGTESEIDAFVALVRTYGIKELVRTGAVVMARGSGSIEEAIKR
jgi:acetolactate synthase-1/3 small subunit